MKKRNQPQRKARVLSDAERYARIIAQGKAATALDDQGAMIVIKDGSEDGDCIFGDLCAAGDLRKNIDSARKEKA